MSKAKACLPKTAPARNHPLTIAAMAEEIAHLRRVATKMDEAHAQQRKIADLAGYNGSIYPYEVVQREADARAGALEEVVRTSEPGNMDEALSLALVILGDLDASDEEDAFGAVAALARWMVRAGAKTPLRPDYYACGYLTPRALEIEEALERADELAIVQKSMATGADLVAQARVVNA